MYQGWIIFHLGWKWSKQNNSEVVMYSLTLLDQFISDM